MKKGFTLVEMLVVVAILVSLMAITFRLSSIGGDQEARNLTVARMQRVENCLSGYYAAFGTYPPVPLTASRDIYKATGDHGSQSSEGGRNTSIWGWYSSTDSSHGIGTTDETRAWRQVRAVCRAQPVECAYPFPKDSGLAEELSEKYKDRVENDEEFRSSLSEEQRKIYEAGFDDGYSSNPGRHGKNAQLFKFGLMSFLLPRYLVMMQCGKNVFTDSNMSSYWKKHNTLPCKAVNGDYFDDWEDVWDCANNNNQMEKNNVKNIPSQSICARWLPNLADSCACFDSEQRCTFYGINLKEDDSIPSLEVESPYGSDSYESQYLLCSITIKDGWGNTYYYYSPYPYQTYTFWSGGKNNRTFPTWIDRSGSEFRGNANRCISAWIEDDIIHMSN